MLRSAVCPRQLIGVLDIAETLVGKGREMKLDFILVIVQSLHVALGNRPAIHINLIKIQMRGSAVRVRRGEVNPGEALVGANV
jgi:hypothetical protein